MDRRRPSSRPASQDQHRYRPRADHRNSNRSSLQPLSHIPIFADPVNHHKGCRAAQIWLDGSFEPCAIELSRHTRLLLLVGASPKGDDQRRQGNACESALNETSFREASLGMRSTATRLCIADLVNRIIGLVRRATHQLSMMLSVCNDQRRARLRLRVLRNKQLGRIGGWVRSRRHRRIPIWSRRGSCTRLFWYRAGRCSRG